jgi:hypothetical protein
MDFDSTIVKIINFITDLINFIICLLLGIFYYKTLSIKLLIPFIAMLFNELIMIQSYIKKSNIIYGIYLISTTIFYLILSNYILWFNIYYNYITFAEALVLMLKMNIPTFVNILAIIINGITIEQEIEIKFS